MTVSHLLPMLCLLTVLPEGGDANSAGIASGSLQQSGTESGGSLQPRALPTRPAHGNFKGAGPAAGIPTEIDPSGVASEPESKKPLVSPADIPEVASPTLIRAEFGRRWNKVVQRLRVTPAHRQKPYAKEQYAQIVYDICHKYKITRNELEEIIRIRR
jgi:hypothetical protein